MWFTAAHCYHHEINRQTISSDNIIKWLPMLKPINSDSFGMALQNVNLSHGRGRWFIQILSINRANVFLFSFFLQLKWWNDYALNVYYHWPYQCNICMNHVGFFIRHWEWPIETINFNSFIEPSLTNWICLKCFERYTLHTFSHIYNALKIIVSN